MSARLYISYIRDADGNLIADGYAYGEEWVAQALYMDDIKFKTPEEARAWWEREYGEKG